MALAAADGNLGESSRGTGQRYFRPTGAIPSSSPAGIAGPPL